MRPSDGSDDPQRPGVDYDLDAYKKVQLVEVRVRDGEVKTGVRVESKRKRVEFVFPE